MMACSLAIFWVPKDSTMVTMELRRLRNGGHRQGHGEQEGVHHVHRPAGTR